MKKINIERSKKGTPCIWEEGGGMTNTGGSIVIANQDGTAPQAIYIKTKGHLACGKHALVPVKEGMYIIDAYHHNRDFVITIYEVVSIGETTMDVEERYNFAQNEWDEDIPEYIRPAVDAAIEKATCYHCRSAHYCKEPQRNITRTKD